MKQSLILAAAALMSLGTSAALADDHATAASGDPEAGEALWRGCRSCHSIVADDGTVIQRGGRTGPNLYGVAGRQPGTEPEFGRYSELMVSFGETGVVWDEEHFVEYVANPVDYLSHHGGEGSRRGTMSFRLTEGAADMWAYLVSVGPEPEGDSE